ncbi:hypothetical protein MesoLjLc_01770 [Mesorhizobium sp. L-8-10]|uniref:DUF6925 family protein n=1 Tax=Mesorhizobium sp. L-8-10 TaxID=2744523 RepID=UPI001928DE0F|nr:hypothetical protein [Mesorhizobium sp. L-8-10]BCH28247.1 hypothetical protein MesoLjLc_01770 [Mesorhizobium sp. L-8-10]
MSELEHLARQHLADWRTGWSMGSVGAIAEFHQDEGETAVIDDGFSFARATRRGGIRLDRKRIGSIIPVAYETLSPKRHRWSHAVALCLPEQDARRDARSVLTEIGPDDNAIRGIDRTGILFDMGLSLPQCDFCIRTSEPKLLAVLRAGLGRSLFEHDNPVMGAILAAHPHRVALTNIGRVEVYQKIGGPDTGGVSPPGPHTHVLPKLLRGGRTHSANTPIPELLMPLGAMHPGNPAIGPLGEDLPFDVGRHRAFQGLLASFGRPDIVEAKQRVLRGIEDGLAPRDFVMPGDRFARSAVRLALRQQARLAEEAGDAALARLVDAWRRQFDPDTRSDDEDDDAPGH